jgi:hypothetical protein
MFNCHCQALAINVALVPRNKGAAGVAMCRSATSAALSEVPAMVRLWCADF